MGIDVRIGEIKPINWEWEEDRPLEIISFLDITLKMSKPLPVSQLPLVAGSLGNNRVFWLIIMSFP